MSITGTLSAALSGLTASSRAAEIVASNIANARTEGYGRRDLHLSARVTGAGGQGVQVISVSRALDLALLNDRRAASAGSAGAAVTADVLHRIETAIGLPGEAGALGTRIGNLEAALIAATGRPDSDARLGEILFEAQGLARHLAEASGTVQTARADADRAIANDVGLLNRTLEQVAGLSTRIAAQMAGGRDASALIDQRQQLVDRIAEIVPVRELQRENGRIALYTAGGAPLVDGRPAQFGFTPVGIVAADMTLASGALSGLTLNGRPLTASGAASQIAGGTLAARFALRDEAAPQAQARLDALARDLVERFGDPAVDPTLPPGGAGLFTDAGASFDPANEAGLASRLRVNAAVDPAAGGDLWRLRDGIGAATPGDAAHSALLSALADALAAPRPAASGGFAGPRSFSGLASDLLSGIAAARLGADAEAGFAAAKAAALRQAEMEAGVDTDRELQMLLLIEQAYAANARVMQAADGMIRTLMEI